MQGHSSEPTRIDQLPMTSFNDPQ